MALYILEDGVKDKGLVVEFNTGLMVLCLKVIGRMEQPI